MGFMSWFFLVVFSLALLWSAWRRPSPPAPRARNVSAGTPHRPRPTAPSPQRTLDTIEWDGAQPVRHATAPKAVADVQSCRLRDRYISARFPGVLRNSEDLLAIEHVIKSARHFFEEGRLDDAAELFELAIEESPQEMALRLAQLEIAFLARDAQAYLRLVRALPVKGPELPEWGEIARLGHALDPAEPMFAAPRTSSGRGHYGPWPAMPNWIQASWDLTSEVLAADFHRAMAAPTENQE